MQLSEVVTLTIGFQTIECIHLPIYMYAYKLRHIANKLGEFQIRINAYTVIFQEV